MRKLIRFECKKALGRGVIRVILLILLALNAVNIERHHHIFKTDPMAQGRYELYTELRGEMTEEKLARIRDNYSAAQQILSGSERDLVYNPERYYSGYAFGDANLWNEVKEELDRINGYEAEMNALADAARTANENPALSPYYRRQNEQIAACYAGRSLHQLSRLDGITALSEYRFSTVLLLMLLILIAGNLYVTERENGMAEMLCTAKNGGMKTAAAKLSAVLLITAGLCVLFSVMDFALFAYYYRIDGLSFPVYAVPSVNETNGFAQSPLSCTVWQYLLLKGAVRLLGLCVFASAFTVISAAIRSAVPVFFGSVLLTAAAMLCYTFWNTGAGTVINRVNPLRLLLTDFKTYSVCEAAGYPVSVPALAVCAGSVLLLINCVCCLTAGRRRV